MTEFRPGQVWEYKTRPGEEASRLVVCRVESGKESQRIVHVHIEGLSIRNPASPDGFTRVISHMPYSEQVLRESVASLESTRDELPGYQEGYAIWKEAFDAGRAGVFSVPVSEGVEFMERAMNR